jgi:hypothetical protein
LIITVIKLPVWIRKEVIMRNFHGVWYTREISWLIEMYLNETYSIVCTCLVRFLLWIIWWRVMPLKTSFRFLIGFITILQVVTTITYYTVTYLHSLHAILFSLSAVVFAYSVSLSLEHLNSLQLSFTCELPVTVSYRELLCSADSLQDNSSARTPRKTVAAGLCWWCKSVGS